MLESANTIVREKSELFTVELFAVGEVCCPRCSCCRLWYVTSVSVDASDYQQQQQSTSLPVEIGCGSTQPCIPAGSPKVEIGCVNVIPKCNDWTGKQPVYENLPETRAARTHTQTHLPETYAAINHYLADSPLEGRLRLHRYFHFIVVNLLFNFPSVSSTTQRCIARSGPGTPWALSRRTAPY